MKHLLTVSDQVWGGKQRFMTDVIAGLRAAGHEVLPVVEAKGAMAAELARLGVQRYTVTSFADDPPGAVSRVRELLDSADGADVVHVTGRYDAAVAERALEAQACPVPMLVMFRHSAFPLEPEGPARRLAERADLIIATSREQAERQFGPGSPSRPVVVLPSAINRPFADSVDELDSDDLRAGWGIGQDTFVFSVLARLSWEKGVDRVIRAIGEIGDSAEDAVLLVAGDGQERGPLQRLTEELGLEARVRFLGHVADVRPVLAVSDAVVLASTVPETGPLALKEAMGAGKPVIASRTGGIGEFVSSNVNGLLVGDDKELAEAMRTLWADSSMATALGRCGRDTILGGHLWEQRMRSLVRLLDVQAIRVLPALRMLRELAWGDVRWRDERAGGFVFVPATSEISELPPEIFEPVKRALARDDVTALAELPAEAAATVIGLLYQMGALSRPLPGAAR